MFVISCERGLSGAEEATAISRVRFSSEPLPPPFTFRATRQCSSRLLSCVLPSIAPKVETGKLERAEAAGKSSREELRRVATQVCDILDNQAPEMDLGADARGDAFAAKALPKFLQLVDSDLRDLEETTGLIRGFAEKHFAKQEDEVARIRSQEASPAGMLRSVLRLAAMALATKACGDAPPPGGAGCPTVSKTKGAPRRPGG